MYKMSETINLAEARKKLPELADRANAGHEYVVSRRGREVAVLIGIDEYRRLKALEQHQRQQDFNLLLAPPENDTPSEEEARQLAIQVVRETRQAHYRTKKHESGG
jgi:prevent-host-death family protein